MEGPDYLCAAHMKFIFPASLFLPHELFLLLIWLQGPRLRLEQGSPAWIQKMHFYSTTDMQTGPVNSCNLPNGQLFTIGFICESWTGLMWTLSRTILSLMGAFGPKLSSVRLYLSIPSLSKSNQRVCSINYPVLLLAYLSGSSPPIFNTSY